MACIDLFIIQAITKQFAEVLHFALSFDEMKVSSVLSRLSAILFFVIARLAA